MPADQPKAIRLMFMFSRLGFFLAKEKIKQKLHGGVR